jgi:hypothetical protein
MVFGKRLGSWAALAAAGIAVWSPASPVFVPNSSFEDVNIAPLTSSVNLLHVPGWTRAGAEGDRAIWRVGYLDGGGTITVAGEGMQFIIGGGGFVTPGVTTWTTTVTGLTPGLIYRLDFMMAAESFDLTQMIDVSFVSGSATPGQTFSATNDLANYWQDWEAKTMEFVASATELGLRFTMSGRFDVGLDNVRVTELGLPVTAAEPGTIAVLGLGLAGLFVARRNSR